MDQKKTKASPTQHDSVFTTLRHHHRQSSWAHIHSHEHYFQLQDLCYSKLNPGTSCCEVTAWTGAPPVLHVHPRSKHNGSSMYRCFFFFLIYIDFTCQISQNQVMWLIKRNMFCLLFTRSVEPRFVLSLWESRWWMSPCLHVAFPSFWRLLDNAWQRLPFGMEHFSVKLNLLRAICTLWRSFIWHICDFMCACAMCD